MFYASHLETAKRETERQTKWKERKDPSSSWMNGLLSTKGKTRSMMDGIRKGGSGRPIVGVKLWKIAPCRSGQSSENFFFFVKLVKLACVDSINTSIVTTTTSQTCWTRFFRFHFSIVHSSATVYAPFDSRLVNEKIEFCNNFELFIYRSAKDDEEMRCGLFEDFRLWHVHRAQRFSNQRKRVSRIVGC